MSERPFSQEGRRLVVAHRGASADAPENTLAAFDLAAELGAGAVEFDVRVTADDQAVVMHDATVDRTTEGTGLVREMTLAEVRQLRVRDSDARVPTLEEVLSLLSGRVAVDIEIKNIPGEFDFDPQRERAVELVHDALGSVEFAGEVIVSSFNPMSLAASLRLRPDVATGLLTNTDVEADATMIFAASQGHRWALPFVGQVRSTPDRYANAAHDAGLLLGTWITDDPHEARALFDAGVDAVATNDPRRIVTAAR